MSVYVDQEENPFGRMIMCHMTADSLSELHWMAEAIGLRRAWFQSKPGKTPHYDLSKTKRAEAVKLGAVEIDRADVVEIIRMWRENPTGPITPLRLEACSRCGKRVRDWVDPDWSSGRVCRPCETKYAPQEQPALF